MDSTLDTSFALATPLPPPSGSGIAIVRVSGPDAFRIAASLIDEPEFDPDNMPDRTFVLATIRHGEIEIDRAGILPFKGPKSYTGEDVVEFHIHGGIAVIRSIESALLASGARQAEPGEFTRRAFLNGRIDLIQAESIASLVGAKGIAAQREALRQRAGSLSDKINFVRNSLHDILARLEVDFDYPEERIDSIDSSDAVREIGKILDILKPLLSSFRTGNILKGFRLAIIGLPNVGKSSLLNALLMEDRAIVASVPGTTRDVVSASLSFAGVPAELLDTAGIRALTGKLDEVEAEGIRRSWREVERAHLVLIVLETSVPIDNETIDVVGRTLEISGKTGSTVLLVCNKSDLAPMWESDEVCGLLKIEKIPYVVVSAKENTGIENLREKVGSLLELESDPQDIILTETRHQSLIAEAVEILKRVRDDLTNGSPQDVAATELWGADRTLGKLLGEGLGVSDLDEIFSRFCIGK
ncbi:MAG: tRNA uridine-5-carboxymethylaminomethyl(34) synthesis GTPase MnmE [bacterium]|nr:tRNA uridine-5-carboxymethylaminomethyl(34) synthesis GTPase MnmE [bacterium]